MRGNLYGTVQALAAPVIALFGAGNWPGVYTARDLLIAIHLVWAVGLVFALIAIGFPDTV